MPPKRDQPSRKSKEARTPTAVLAGTSIRKRGRPPLLHEYDDEIVELYNKGFKPHEIANRLRVDHHLDMSFMNRSTVENRLRYLKLGKKRRLASLSEPKNLKAADVPRTCMQSLAFLFLDLTSVQFEQGKGQQR